MSTVSQEGNLYEARRKIYPMAITGFFRTLKWRIMIVTLAIYYITPWIRWDRGPYAPDQAVLVDLANQRFYFFFIEIWPQEFYYVAGLLIMAGLGLFLVTTTIGRAWCGYTCPQTVWTDLFVHVERWIDGDRNAQIRLNKAKWSPRKIGKRVAKHSLWILIGLLTGGAWVFYFADAPTLAQGLVSGTAPNIAYVTIALLTTTTYVFGGLMREQVCIYMCPWPRIQIAMLDEDSLVVTYRDFRGEPRSTHAKKQAPGTVGDCVDCNKCVAVCPMGIDIRDGQQLACITCALCIDACDEVMDRVGSPRGLISYDTLANYEAAGRGEAKRHSIRTVLRPRTLIYATVLALIAAAMIYSLLVRAEVNVSVLRDRNPVYVTLSDGSIRNGYTVKIINKKLTPRRFRINVTGIPGAVLHPAGASHVPSPTVDIEVGADTLGQEKLFMIALPGSVQSSTIDIRFHVRDIDSGEMAIYDGVFRGPEK